MFYAPSKIHKIISVPSHHAHIFFVIRPIAREKRAENFALIKASFSKILSAIKHIWGGYTCKKLKGVHVKKKNGVGNILIKYP